MVGSTEIAAELGDVRWRELLRRHHEILRRELKRFGGREVDTAGDGAFAIFDVPAQAVRCACAIAEETQELGVDIRAGLHVGEVEVAGKEVRGIAVHTGSRVCAFAGPTDILVTSTLTELVGGAGLEFEFRGVQTFKGVPGRWRVFNVTKVAAFERPTPRDRATAADRLALIEPPRFTRRNKGWVAAGIAVALVGLVTGMVLALRSSPPSKVVLAPPGSVVRIDPDTGRILQQGARDLSLGGEAFRSLKIAVGEGAIWLLADPNLLQLDQTTGAFRSAIPNIDDFAIGQGAVWVVMGFSGAGDSVGLQAIDPATGDVLIHAVGGAPIASSPQAIWEWARGEVAELDPRTGQHLAHFPLESPPSAISSTATDAWIADNFMDTLTRIDVGSGRLKTRSLAATPNRMVVGNGYVWTLDIAGGTVTVIDASTGLQIDVIRVSADPTDLAYGLGSVSVPDRRGFITRIDAGTRLVSRIDVGVPVAAIAVDEPSDSLWAVVATTPPPD